jgi:1-pyrroline-5-carboxylate dehydrogenase
MGHELFGPILTIHVDDEAGSSRDLLRRISPRTIRETFVPPTDERQPHRGP